MATTKPAAPSSPDPADFLSLSSADDILSALGGAVWAPPVRANGSRPAGPTAIPLAWPDSVVMMAEKFAETPCGIPFILPASLPPRHPYSKERGLIAMQPAQLEMINAPIPSRGSQRRPTLNLLADLVHGQYNGKAIPNMAEGESLPLALVLGILLLNPGMYSKNSFFRTLWDGRHGTCLLGAIARVSNRFVVCDHNDGMISLVQDWYEAKE